MPAIKDSKGLVISYWNRFMKKTFNSYITMHDLWKDLNQEIETIAIEISQYDELEDAGKIIGNRFRTFIKNMGFRKTNGKFEINELIRGEIFWSTINKTGKTPNGYESDKYATFVGNIKMGIEEKMKHLLKLKLLRDKKRTLEICGHEDWKKCYRCKKYDNPENMIRFVHGKKTTKVVYAHSMCLGKKEEKEYKKIKEELTKEEKQRIEEEKKEHKKTYRKAYVERNKELIKSYKKTYEEKNKERIKLRKRKNYEKNKEIKELQKKEYYEKNKEIIEEQKRLKAEINKEKSKEYRRIYKEKNKEKIKKYAKIYYEKNKEKWSKNKLKDDKHTETSTI